MGRIVEVATEGYSLRIERGFLVLAAKNTARPDSRIPLDEIESLIISSTATSLTSSVQASLAERGTPIVFCDTRHLPIAMSLPISHNYEYSKRLKCQAQISQNKADQIWGQIVRSKISRQAEVLDQLGGSGVRLRRIASKVGNGDPTNCEAEAAKMYWKDLFGYEFRRNAEDGVNARLNYGYAVLRATVARYVCAHGLSPSLGIHHKNAANPMCLVDDLMEPFRPLIDWTVAKMKFTDERISKNEKMNLVHVMTQKVRSQGNPVVFESLIRTTVLSFYRICSETHSTLVTDWHLPDQSE